MTLLQGYVFGRPRDREDHTEPRKRDLVGGRKKKRIREEKKRKGLGLDRSSRDISIRRTSGQRSGKIAKIKKTRRRERSQ